jgi:arylsulfatase A-like enzyme
MSRRRKTNSKKNHKPRRTRARSPEVTRRDLLKGALMGGIAAAVGGGILSGCESPMILPAARAATGSLPNILFVFSDSHRASAWSGGAESHVITPHLGQMADQGVVFSQCVANYPLCSPARASLLTGLYPQTHGVTENLPNYCSTPLDPRFATVAEVCQRAGYATGYIGRWHLDTVKLQEDIPPGPKRQGFDHYWRHIRVLYARGYRTWTFDAEGRRVDMDPWSVPAQTEMVIEGIRKLKDRPFCLFVSFTPPHSPYEHAPAEWRRRYQETAFPLRPNVTRHPDATREQLCGYYAFISGIDAAMGRLMRALDEMGLAADTILVYTSDHGELVNSHDHWTKYFPWEESIGVPLLIRWPRRLKGGRRLDLPAGTVDLSPTLLGLAGLPIPPAMEGRNLSPMMLNGAAHRSEDSLFLMRILLPGVTDIAASGDWRGVRTGRHTYARLRSGGASQPWLLYDNREDPFQIVNLVGNPRHQALQRHLEAELARWIRRTGDDFPA